MSFKKDFVPFLVVLVGYYCAITGVLGVPVGAFVGPHILVPALVHLVFAAICFFVVYKWL